MWHLFSGIADKVQYGVSQYHWRRKDHTTLIKKLYAHYQVEGIVMPYTWNDFYREFTKEHLDLLPAEDRLKGLPAEDRLKGLPAKDRLKGLPAKDRLKGLPAEDRLKGLPAEAFLKSMPVEAIEAYLKKLRKGRSQRKRK
jgi:hypothetical protein